MTKGLVIAVGAPKDGGSDVQDQERRNALRAFMSACQNGDVEQGMKAWARMGEAGPPSAASEGDEGTEAGPDIEPKGKKTSMYTEEG